MEKKHKIGNVTAGMMVVTALIVDAVQALLTFSVFLLPLSVLITFMAATMFFLWFALSGVKYVGNDGGKKLLIALASTVAELVPVVNAIPATTAGVIGIIVQTRIEDARAQAGGKVTPRTAMASARLQKMNQARAAREDSAREGREGTQQARHTPANNTSAHNTSEAA